MNSKKSNRLFLSIVVLHFVVITILVMNSRFFSIGIVENLFVSQMIIFMPACVALLFGKEKTSAEELGFRRVRKSTLVLTALYTMACMPLVTMVNAISMLFVDNTVEALSPEILEVSFPIMFVMMALIGPFSEEFVFRGMIFNGYRQDGNTFGALILSALVFGCMHMNLNQACYAFVLGIALALLMVATKSIWPSFFMHLLINGETVCMMYLSRYLTDSELTAQTEAVTRQELYSTILVYGVISIFTTALAAGLLIWISVREGRREQLKSLFVKPENAKRRISLSLVIALLITIGYMALEIAVMQTINT